MQPDYNRRMANPVGTAQPLRSGILVTGGAGYIGSHTVLQLRERGERVVVLDDLSTGFRQAVLDTPLVLGDVADTALVSRVLREHAVALVLDFLLVGSQAVLVRLERDDGPPLRRRRPCRSRHRPCRRGACA